MGKGYRKGSEVSYNEETPYKVLVPMCVHLLMIAKYKSMFQLYKFVSMLIKLIPIPKWITIKTRYGLMQVPKTFRILTMTLDLVEPEVKNWVEHSFKDAKIFIDVGAAQGYYTLKAVKIMRNGFVLSFEPDPSTYKILQANLAINNVQNVKTFDVALNDTDGEIQLGKSEVRSRKLDSILEEEGIELQENDVIKIDVEGMALNVLEGAVHTLKRSRPKLVIELHSGTRERVVEQFLKNLEYRTSRPSKYFAIAEWQKL